MKLNGYANYMLQFPQGRGTRTHCAARLAKLSGRLAHLFRPIGARFSGKVDS